MHAIGARLSAARCLWAQAHAHRAFVVARSASARPGCRQLHGHDPTQLLRSALCQTRCFSSRPNSSAPDKPADGSENDEGKEKGGQPAASPEASESPTETKRQPLFSTTNGRGRSSSHASSTGGLPPFTLPSWFLEEQVQIRDIGGTGPDKAWAGLGRYLQETRPSAAPAQALGGIWASDESPKEADAETPEHSIGRELVATISAELEATAPPMRATKDPKRRPVSLLYVHNYKGSRMANAIIGRIGDELAADVVHLDAAKLARLAAPYFGSTLYFGRGKMSMLGYAAAEVNGRSSMASTPAEEGEDDMVLRGTSVFKFLQPSDDRVTWDELKLGQVAKVLADAASVKRVARGVQPDKPDRVILHLHNYVELTMTPEGASLINKLRTTVDRLWQNGVRIVIVGSASNDTNATSRWHAKVKDLISHDCYPIVFSPNTDELAEWADLERKDYLQDNLDNITWMLECLNAEPVSVVLPVEDSSPGSNKAVDELKESLSTGIRSNHWIYRLATQAIGFQRYQDGPLDIHTLAEALRRMKRVDDARYSILGSNRATGVQSTATTSFESSPIENLISLGNDNSPDSKVERRRNPKNMNLDDEEKKLLSGLVNEADIHTTFDDVIASPDVRDSLLALTTLSLQHPKAFSYGVLARERIHGALLYGPPGTGKTLMAKALAKESGANMLEISAASINDMWVGNSEKNVRAVFSLARKMSPMVVFLDEADSLLGSRARQPNRGGYRETINQFLREWDGLTNSINTQQIFILVSTNRPQDMDEAVLRRLPRRILVDLPLREGRLAILQSLLRDEALDESVSLDGLASQTELYSGSDLKNLAVAAAMEAAKEELAARNNHPGPDEYEFPARRILSRRHFDKAIRDITASISEDMQSLKALRKFDTQYGDGRRKKKKSHMGFEVVPHVVNSEEARVRNP